MLVSRARYAKAKRRWPKIRAFRTGRQGFGKVFTCGVVPSVSYAAELAHPHPADLTKLRAWAVEAAGMPRCFVARDIVFLLLGPARDPGCTILEKALLRYHLEWWYTTLPAGDDALAAAPLVTLTLLQPCLSA